MMRVLLFVLALSVGVVVGYFLHPDAPIAPSRPEPTNDTVTHPRTSEAARGTVAKDVEQPAPQPEPKREAAGGTRGMQLDYDPAFGAVVYGTVRSSDGRPIEEARLYFTSAVNSKVRRSADVATGSGYALTGLTPGRWNAYCKPVDFSELNTEIEVLDAPTQRIDFTLAPSFLVTVKLLTPSGQPLHEALQEARLGYGEVVNVVASRTPFERDLPMTELRGYSRYGIGSWQSAHGFDARRGNLDPAARDVAGTLELSTSPPVFVAAVFRHVVLATATVDAGQQEVVLEVSLDKLRSSFSTISLQVVNGVTGAPVAGALVGLTDSQSRGGSRSADEQGRFTFENERVGILELDIYGKNLERYHKLLRVHPGERDLGVITLYPPKQVAVTVHNTDGTPAAGATVQWQNLDRRTFPQPSRSRQRWSADAEGNITLGDIGPGTYMVQAFTDDAHATTVVNTAAIGDEPLQLTLEPSLRVEIPGTPEAERTELHCLTIFDARRTPVWARFLRGYPTSASLPAGRYHWELHDGTTLLRNGDFELKPGGPTPTIGAR